MKASAAQIRAALESPKPDIRLFLLHGPDAAGAAVLAKRLATAMGADAERVDFDGSQLKSDPSRLIDEAASMSLFGGARHIRVSGAGEESLEAFTSLLTADMAGNPVVAIAPTVKATAKIVKLAIESPRAMAFACYPPTSADFERLAATLVRDAGLRATPPVLHRLSGLAGGDVAVLAQEVEKLALYLDAAPDRPADLTDDALDALGADLGETELSRVVEAVIAGRPGVLGEELVKLREAGTSPIPWLRQLTRRLVVLADIRSDMEAGANPDSAIKRQRIHFSEEAATKAAIRRWSPLMLAKAIAQVREAERAVMAPGNPGPIAAETVVTRIAQGIERRR
ncbi:DNA polymerase III subunit delta [Sphingomonas sp. Leaf17]|uniref:DNA polymerase III subunit delta n=1 Tax=Sphingomonas sp. Leaf17 TaxID=1735683 RepID=UPI0006F6CFB6|nr:DNA polymerase III subunit delta [Sphingomonas sp. Leaf17]KQM62483.1 DNA polymerase III subunit delta [Sphingomonas sp. Leaf17]